MADVKIKSKAFIGRRLERNGRDITFVTCPAADDDDDASVDQLFLVEYDATRRRVRLFDEQKTETVYEGADLKETPFSFRYDATYDVRLIMQYGGESTSTRRVLVSDEARLLFEERIMRKRVPPDLINRLLLNTSEAYCSPLTLKRLGLYSVRAVAFLTWIAEKKDGKELPTLVTYVKAEPRGGDDYPELICKNSDLKRGGGESATTPRHSTDEYLSRQCWCAFVPLERMYRTDKGAIVEVDTNLRTDHACIRFNEDVTRSYDYRLHIFNPEFSLYLRSRCGFWKNIFLKKK